MSRLSQVEYSENTVTQEVDIATLRKQIAADYDKRWEGQDIKHQEAREAHPIQPDVWQLRG